jgi:zinc/manganese transport system substrate-binding protein
MTPPLVAPLLTALALSLAWPVTAHAKVSIVASVPDLAAIAQAVGGDDVEVISLALPSQDPHYVDARPSLLLPLSRADLLIVNGLGLEIGWLPPLLRNSRNAKIQQGSSGYFDASTVVTAKDIEVADRARGDIHPGGNPHYLHDPRAARLIVHSLAHRLAALDGAHAGAFLERGAAFMAQLDALALRERKRFLALPLARRRVVPYHRSLTYLADWLALEPVITVESKPGVAPNPGHVAEVLKTMKRTGARVILQEEYYPSKTSGTLARLVSGQLVVLPGGARLRSGESYLARLTRTADVVYHALAQ